MTVRAEMGSADFAGAVPVVTGYSGTIVIDRDRAALEVLRGAAIMIVDDVEANVRLLQVLLEEAGYTNVISSRDARGALDMASEALPDLILLDLMMPGMDGFQMLHQLRPLIPAEDFLPILVLTADAGPETKRKALAVGATDFLVKPIDRVEVLLRIHNLLHTRFLHKELQAQNRLLEAKVLERTRELTCTLREVVTAQETERRRISMDLHDGPLQLLGVCTMSVDRVIRNHERGQHEQIMGGLRELRTILNSTIDDTREILADLSLDVLKRQGLGGTLRDYVSRYLTMTDIKIKLDIDDNIEGGANVVVPPQVQFLMYRIAQEALANIRKHARARHVNLSLRVEGDALDMEITDDGAGFDADRMLEGNHAGKHLGLRSMRERIRKARGEMWIDSRVGEGTRLKFRCPLTVNGAGSERPVHVAAFPGKTGDKQ